MIGEVGAGAPAKAVWVTIRPTNCATIPTDSATRRISYPGKKFPAISVIVKEQPRKVRVADHEVGEVIEEEVESTGYDEIDALLLEKMYTSWYRPAKLRGESVKAWIVVGYGYRVDR